MDPAIETARTERLKLGLHNLAAWCHARAEGEHDNETTLTMLKRKAAELEDAVNRAGAAAASENFSPCP